METEKDVVTQDVPYGREHRRPCAKRQLDDSLEVALPELTNVDSAFTHGHRNVAARLRVELDVAVKRIKPNILSERFDESRSFYNEVIGLDGGMASIGFCSSVPISKKSS